MCRGKNLVAPQPVKYIIIYLTATALAKARLVYIYIKKSSPPEGDSGEPPQRGGGTEFFLNDPFPPTTTTLSEATLYSLSFFLGF